MPDLPTKSPFKAGDRSLSAEQLARLWNAARNSQESLRTMPTGALKRQVASNPTGANLTAYSVIGLGDIQYDPQDDEADFLGAAYFAGAAPSRATHGPNWGIFQASVDNGKIAEVLTAGMTQVQINVVAEGDGFAELANADSTQLQSTSNGPARILWKESGTGTKWAVVELGQGLLQISEWTNVGSVDSVDGGVLTTDRSGNPTGLTGGKLALQVPDSDAAMTLYVSIGAAAVGASGFCFSAKTCGVFRGQVDSSMSADTPVGAFTDQATFAKNVPGLRCVAYQGNLFGDGVLWADLERANRPCLCKAVAAESAGKIDLNTVDEDGNVSGKDFTVNVAG